MSWEISYTEGIEKDFLELGFKDSDMLKLKSKMEFYSQNPFIYAEKIKSIPFELWKFKFWDFRIFVSLDHVGEIIYCLAILPRKNCYDKVSLNKVLTLVRDIYK